MLARVYRNAHDQSAVVSNTPAARARDLGEQPVGVNARHVVALLPPRRASSSSAAVRRGSLNRAVTGTRKWPTTEIGSRPIAAVRFSTEQTVNESSRRLHRRLAGTFGTDTRPSPESRWRRSAALIAINATAASSVHDARRYRRTPPCAPSRPPLVRSCLLAVRTRQRLLIRP